MKTLMRWMVIVGTLSGGTAHAQNVTGTWQGTLSAGKELRIVITISNAAGGGLTGMMYSIDQGAPPKPMGCRRYSGIRSRHHQAEQS